MADEVDPTQYKKDELVAAADVQGVDVASGDTKADIAAKLSAAPGVQPVFVTNFNRRSGDDALPGSWVDVVSGEYQGRRGHYFEDVSHGPDGFPTQVHVRTRDADNLVVTVGYDEIRPSEFNGGR